MPAYLAATRDLADGLRHVPNVRVIPDPPQTPMMHLLLEVPADRFQANAVRLAERGIATWPECFPTLDPSVQRVEFSAGDATLQWERAALSAVIAELVAS